MGGNKHGTASDQRVTLDLAPDYYQIASESRYNYSRDEKGKGGEAHKDVKEWHYFINDILFQENGSDKTAPYRVTVNVKERSDGSFVYSFSAERQKEGTNTRQTLHADVIPAENSEDNVHPYDVIIRDDADNSQEQTEKKFAKKPSTTESQDAEYLSLAEKYRDGTASEEETAQLQRAVEQAANAAGYVHHLYHGTDAEFTSFDLRKFGGQHGKGEGYGIYLSSDKIISGAYGNRVIDSYTRFNRLADGSKKTLSRAELKNLIKARCEQEAQQMVQDGEYDSVDEALKDTFVVTGYVYTPSYQSMDRVYTEVANKLYDQNDNDADIVNEIMAASGANYDYDNAVKFYEEVLTPTTGIDGFKYGNVYLALSSDLEHLNNFSIIF